MSVTDAPTPAEDGIGCPIHNAFRIALRLIDEAPCARASVADALASADMAHLQPGLLGSARSWLKSWLRGTTDWAAIHLLRFVQRTFHTQGLELRGATTLEEIAATCGSHVERVSSPETGVALTVGLCESRGDLRVLWQLAHRPELSLDDACSQFFPDRAACGRPERAALHVVEREMMTPIGFLRPADELLNDAEMELGAMVETGVREALLAQGIALRRRRSRWDDEPETIGPWGPCTLGYTVLYAVWACESGPG